MIRIAVTGGAGQIAYQLLFHLAAGEPFGKEEIELRILEVPQVMEALHGVEMELHDGAFPQLHRVVIGSDPRELFDGVDWALLIGAKPRGPGMERSDLLNENAKIFIEQGQALNEVAPQATAIVVGNPCNTNAWIIKQMAPQINVYAMTTLDENRAKAQLAKKAGVHVRTVKNMTIWGNHSTTQVPDFTHATIQGQPVSDVIRDRPWLEGEFQSIVQQRGAEVIRARGKSSAASAARALLDLMRNLLTPTPEGEWFSVARPSEGNSYGIDPDLLFSFPCRSNGNGEATIVPGLRWDPLIKENILASENELREERACVQQLMKKESI